MIGPVPMPGSMVNQHVIPIANQAPASADAMDSPTKAVGTRQALVLPADRVELANEAQNAFVRKDANQQHAYEAPKAPLKPARNAGVRFRILKDLSNRIQGSIVDRNTQEVIRSVPPENLVNFYEKFRQVSEALTIAE